MKNATLALSALLALGVAAYEPIQLKATDFVRATGNPSLVTWAQGATHIPVWSLSGGQHGQSVVAVTPPLPNDCGGVKVELLVVNNDPSANASFSDVYRAHISQIVPGEKVGFGERIGRPVRFQLAGQPGIVRSLVVEGYRKVVPGAPLVVRIQREPNDAADTFEKPAGLIAAHVTPLAAPPPARVVEESPGYNSWPMTQAVGNRLVCCYSRGSAHTINEFARDAYARTSVDGGRTWSPEVCFSKLGDVGEVLIGKGLDRDGAALFWVRCMGPKSHHDLWRTVDGIAFEKIAEPKLSPFPMQITDIFPTRHGLMCLWFATWYKERDRHWWGTLTSTDNGRSWTQRTVEEVQDLSELPTEPCVLPLGDGRILGLARTERSGSGALASEFQLTSADDGLTWKKTRTNITDILASTPSLVHDAAKGTMCVYYYERGRQVIKRRVARVADVWDNPFAWPAPEGVVLGDEARPCDAGNVNVTTIGPMHYLSYYSGTEKDTRIYVAPVPAP